MFSFSRKKNPLSSVPPAIRRNNNLTVFKERNPMKLKEEAEVRERLITRYIKAHKSSDSETVVFLLPFLSSYFKSRKGDKNVEQYLTERFKRSQSDLSNISQNDVDSIKYELEDAIEAAEGGKRKTRKRNKNKKPYTSRKYASTNRSTKRV